MNKRYLYNILTIFLLAMFYFSVLKYILPSYFDKSGLEALFIFTAILGAITYFVIKCDIFIKFILITLIVTLVLLVLEGSGDPAKPTIHLVGIAIVVPFCWAGIGISSLLRSAFKKIVQ